MQNLNNEINSIQELTTEEISFVSGGSFIGRLLGAVIGAAYGVITGKDVGRTATDGAVIGDSIL